MSIVCDSGKRHHELILMSNECNERALSLKWNKHLEEEASQFILVMPTDWGVEREQSWARQRRGQCFPHHRGKATVCLTNKTCTEPIKKALICRNTLQIPQSLMERKWDDGWVEWGRPHLANQTGTLHIKRTRISDPTLHFGGSQKLLWPCQTSLLLCFCLSPRHL